MFQKTLLLVVVSAVLAGCVQSSGQSIERPVDEAEGGVLVSGVVISEELFPVQNAEVRLLPKNESTFTDVAGNFVFAAVLPGSYTLNVTAPNYEGNSLSIEVQGPTEGVRVALKGVPGKTPYVSTIPFTGFEVCNFAVVYSAGPIPVNPCPLGEPATTFSVDVGPDWAANVMELDWETSDTMIFATSVATEEDPDRAPGCQTGVGHDWCTAMIWGAAPLRIYSRPNDTEYAAKYAIDGKEVWPGGRNFTSWMVSSYNGYLQEEVNGTFYDECVAINRQFNVPEQWGCPFGIGVSTGIKVQYYHTTFYMQPPAGRLEDYTALPDQ
jgi:hypothetical protein